MKFSIHIISLVATASLLSATDANSARPNSWLHVYEKSGHITTNKVSDIDSVTFHKDPVTLPPTHEKTKPASAPVSMMHIVSPDSVTLIPMASIDSVRFGTNVPSVYINIDDNEEVVNKEKYLNASIWIEGYGAYDDFPETAVQIRGRGNSTWNYPKKPYRLKFAKKQQFAGMRKAKNFALLANFLDGTLLKNAVAFKLAELLEMPYTSHNVPVNLYVNGTYRGAYTINEKQGINSGCVDIDENTGIMWELDTNYDEDYKFTSAIYELPAMVKDPDLEEICEDNPELGTPDEYLALWADDFNRMENAVSLKSENIGEFIDLEATAKYVLVNTFVRNSELAHPKSVYLYKESMDDLYHFGPVWDFDWALTFDTAEGENLAKYRWPLIDSSSSSKGSRFWYDLCSNPVFREEYQKQWERFCNELFPKLMQFFDEYAQSVKVSASQNGDIWNIDNTIEVPVKYKDTTTFEENVERLREFINLRLEWLKTAPNYGIYSNPK